MKTVYLIEEIWTDSMENDIDRAFGYWPICVVGSEIEAQRIVDDAGTALEGLCWAIPKGGVPKKRFKPLPFQSDGDAK